MHKYNFKLKFQIEKYLILILYELYQVYSLQKKSSQACFIGVLLLYAKNIFSK